MPFFLLGFFPLQTGVERNDARIASLLSLAHAAVQAEVTGSRPLVAKAGQAQTPTQAVFVTIERNGAVIGCRGSLVPRCRFLENEVVEAARAASGHDPRYKPLTPATLQGVLVTITIIERLEPMDARNLDTLSPSDGLVLTLGGKTGVVLPWEGKDARTRLQWAYQKAGVAQGIPCLLRRMIAQRYRG